MLTLSRGRYELAEPLRMGPLTQTFRVARALDVAHDGRRLLAKQLLPSLAADEALVRRFLDKAAQNAALVGPERVSVRDFGVDGSGVYLLVDEVDGVSLRTLTAGLAALGRAMPGETACYLAHAMLSALVPAHASAPPLVHLDLDLDALLVRSDGAIVLTELGLWDTLAPADASRLRLARGRIHYAAPELARTDGRGLPASDVFSVGALLFELLTGRHPFAGANQMQVALAIAEGRRAPTREAAPVLSAALCDVLDLMLAHAPEERFQSARAALTALDSVCPTAPAARHDLATLSVLAGAGAASGIPSPAASSDRTSGVHCVPPVAGERTSGLVFTDGARSRVQERAALTDGASASHAFTASDADHDGVQDGRRADGRGARTSLVSLVPPPLVSLAGTPPPLAPAPVAPRVPPSLPAPPSVPPPLGQASAPLVPLGSSYRSGGTTFLKRNLAPHDAPPVHPPEPASVAPPPALAPYSLPPPAFTPPSAPPAKAGARWFEPSKTLFEMRAPVKGRMERSATHAPSRIVLALAVVFGFAGCIALYLLIRLLR